MKKLLAIILLSLAGALTPASGTEYASQRLAKIARCLSLPQIDTLSEGSHYSYKYRGHALSIRKNRFNEIEHVGLLLFPEWYRRTTVARPICDFIERNMLERLLPALDNELKFLQNGEHVYFVKGTAQTALSIDTTDVYQIQEERIDFKSYRVSWLRQGQEVLKLTFDMDYQLLSGCNSIELEQRFAKSLRRFVPHQHVPLQPRFPKHTNVYVAAGDTFLIREMRNELYYEHDKNGWHLTASDNNTSKTLSNMLLSLDFSGNPMLELTIDKFGYETEQATVPYKNLLQMCLDEGCTPFFGIKERTDSLYRGTVLLTNDKGGYFHLLSVDIPLSTIEAAGNGSITGRLYVYTPMHNLSKDYFKSK